MDNTPIGQPRKAPGELAPALATPEAISWVEPDIEILSGGPPGLVGFDRLLDDVQPRSRRTLFVQADSGQGKTRLLQEARTRLAAKGRVFRWIDLGVVAAAGNQSLSATEFIEQARPADIEMEDWAKAYEQRAIVILIDGVDSILVNAAPNIERLVVEIALGFHDFAVIATARTLRTLPLDTSYSDARIATIVRIAPFTDTQIATFLSRLNVKSGRVQAALREPALRELARSPFLLERLALLIDSDGADSRPLARSTLLDSTLKLASVRVSRQSGLEFTAPELRSILPFAAACAATSSDGSVSIAKLSSLLVRHAGWGAERARHATKLFVHGFLCPVDLPEGRWQFLHDAYKEHGIASALQNHSVEAVLAVASRHGHVLGSWLGQRGADADSVRQATHRARGFARSHLLVDVVLANRAVLDRGSLLLLWRMAGTGLVQNRSVMSRAVETLQRLSRHSLSPCERHHLLQYLRRESSTAASKVRADLSRGLLTIDRLQQHRRRGREQDHSYGVRGTAAWRMSTETLLSNILDSSSLPNDRRTWRKVLAYRWDVSAREPLEDCVSQILNSSSRVGLLQDIVWVLGELGLPESVDTLSRAFKAETMPIGARKAALLAMSNIGGRHVEDLLMDELRLADSPFTAAALRVSARVHHYGAVDGALRVLQESPDTEAQIEAAYALGRLGDKGACERMLEVASTSPDLAVATACLQHASHLHSPKLKNALVGASRSEHAQLRRRAMEALLRKGCADEIVRDLDDHLAFGRPEVRQLALEAADKTELSDEQVSRLVGIATETDGSQYYLATRQRALRAISRHLTPAVAPQLEEAMADEQVPAELKCQIALATLREAPKIPPSVLSLCDSLLAKTVELLRTQGRQSTLYRRILECRSNLIRAIGFSLARSASPITTNDPAIELLWRVLATEKHHKPRHAALAGMCTIAEPVRSARLLSAVSFTPHGTGQQSLLRQPTLIGYLAKQILSGLVRDDIYSDDLTRLILRQACTDSRRSRVVRQALSFVGHLKSSERVALLRSRTEAVLAPERPSQVFLGRLAEVSEMLDRQHQLEATAGEFLQSPSRLLVAPQSPARHDLFVIFTSTPREQQAVRAACEDQLGDEIVTKLDEDNVAYSYSSLPGLVVAPAPKQGSADLIVTVSAFILPRPKRIRCAILVGVAAGLDERGIRLADVVAAPAAHSLAHGTTTAGGLELEPEAIRSSDGLIKLLGGIPPDEILEGSSIFCKDLASNESTVVRSRSAPERLAALEIPEAVAIDREAYSFLKVASNRVPHFGVVKGVSDFGDEDPLDDNTNIKRERQLVAARNATLVALAAIRQLMQMDAADSV